MDRQRPVDLGLTPVFRVGVTGHRNLPARAQEWVGEAIGACLTGVKAQLEASARASAAHAAYRRGASGTPSAQLRLISLLAEGADRLAARQALDLGAELDAPLPFAAEEYEKDFSDSVAEFRQLLSKARVLTLDGLRDGGVAQTESYESAGRFLARNCDLLMAIWDGKPARGRGGTAEIVRYSVRIGVPVWWIDSNGEAGAKLLRKAFDLNAPEGAPEGEAASNALRRLIDEAVTPPSPAPAARSGVLGWIAGAIRRRFDPETTPLEDFFDEAPRRRMFPWRAHAFVTSWVLPKSAGNSVRLAAPVSDLERYWSDRFVALDEASSSYAERYRSTYALTAALALIATLAFTALGGATISKLESALAIAVEIAALFGIAALVVANSAYRWHERWVSYRLLAELCREQYVLCPLGRALPGGHVAWLSHDVEEGEPASPNGWVAWYFLAALRGAQFPSGDIGQAKARTIEIALSLIDEQVAYHRARLSNMRAASGRVAILVEAFFALTFLVSVGKLLFVFDFAGRWFKPGGLLGAFLSAGAGALVGLRAYSEFSLLARQSTVMLRMLEAARADLAAVEVAAAQPLGSLALGSSLYQTTTAMLREVAGWAELFRIKTIETS